MEILAPAGSFESLKAAVQNGADAVYLGGSGFNARAFAQGVGNLEAAVRYAHVHGVDVHYTLNTVLLDKELEAFEKQASDAAQAGVDAFIVADLGAFDLLQHLFPTIPLHASTQLSIRSTQTAQAVSNLGFTRLVLAREVPAEEVQQIHGAAAADIEVFCHGALCVCASGRCLMSSLIGGRSANRGACAQPCRLSYTIAGSNGHFLNTKDLCLADETAILRKAGVSSLKIEGRMKGPLYVAAAVRAYREACDSGSVSDEAMNALLLTFSRGGFTKGPFMSDPDRFHPVQPGHTGIPLGRVLSVKGRTLIVATDEALVPGDTVAPAGADQKSWRVSAAKREGMQLVITLDRPAEFKPGVQLLKKSDAQIIRMLEDSVRSGHRRVNIALHFKAQPDDPVSLAVHLPDGRTVTAEGPIPETALNKPLHEKDAAMQLNKTGATPFRVESISAEIAPGLALAKSALNELRRKALAEAEDLLTHRYGNRRTGTVLQPDGSRRPRIPRKLACMVRTREQAEALQELTDVLYVPATLDAFPEAVRILPNMASSRETEKVLRNASTVLTGCLLPDMTGQIADSAFNVTNSLAMRLLRDLGVQRVTLSEELNSAQIRDLIIPDGIETEVIGYGYQTLMITENCPVPCDGKRCRILSENLNLKDRRGKAFPLLKDSKDVCRVRILNTLPLYAADIMEEISCDVVRLVFTVETPQTCRQIAAAYRNAMAGKEPAEFAGEFTRGHLRRGL